MEYKFYVDQMVRIGNECSSGDPNYHKRGRVKSLNDENFGYMVVDMIDPFDNGETHITWCRNALWEPCPNQICCKSLL